MRVSPGALVVGRNPYNRKKQKFTYLGKNKGIGCNSHPIRLYDREQHCEIMITKEFAKLWKIKPYE